MSKPRSRRAQPSRASVAHSSALRGHYAQSLHRRPCRWDVLVFELAVQLATTCTQVRVRLLRQPLKIKPQLTDNLGDHLARGFETFLQQWLWGRPASLGPAPDLANLTDDVARQIAAAAAQHAYEPLLRKYVQDMQNDLLPTPDRDVTTFAQALADTTSRFLATRCLAGGDLRDALTDPLGSDRGYFPDNGLPADPPRSSGDALLDIRRLAVRIHPTDGRDELKGRLIGFCWSDPWLNTELAAAIAEAEEIALQKLEQEFAGSRLDDVTDQEAMDARLHESKIEAIDNFCFAATRLDGRTPIELAIDRQPDMDAALRARLLRWNEETFYGAFVVKRARRDELAAVRVGNGREYRLVATRKGALPRRVDAGTVFLSRVVPWDDYWLLSGIQKVMPSRPGLDYDTLREELLLAIGNRLYDADALELQRAWEIQYEQHQFWVELFGTEELLFDNVRDMQEALRRFYHEWQDHPGPEGESPRQAFERIHGKPAPPGIDLAANLPEYFEGETDLAFVYDREAGQLMLTGYRAFRDALAAGAKASPAQARLVFEWLTDDSIDVCLFQRARAAMPPEQLEAVMRLALRDQTFRLDADFDRVLRKYKGEQLRHRRPYVAVVSGARFDHGMQGS